MPTIGSTINGTRVVRFPDRCPDLLESSSRGFGSVKPWEEVNTWDRTNYYSEKQEKNTRVRLPKRILFDNFRFFH
jgi:hypothetical protein